MIYSTVLFNFHYDNYFVFLPPLGHLQPPLSPPEPPAPPPHHPLPRSQGQRHPGHGGQRSRVNSPTPPGPSPGLVQPHVFFSQVTFSFSCTCHFCLACVAGVRHIGVTMLFSDVQMFVEILSKWQLCKEWLCKVSMSCFLHMKSYSFLTVSFGVYM